MDGPYTREMWGCRRPLFGKNVTDMKYMNMNIFDLGIKFALSG
jgi:hypothetical protein